MGQVLHGSAKTTHAIRGELQRSQASVASLAKRFGINEKTVIKWRKRQFVEDMPMGPKERRSTVLSPMEEAQISASSRRARTSLSLSPIPFPAVVKARSASFPPNHVARVSNSAIVRASKVSGSSSSASATVAEAAHISSPGSLVPFRERYVSVSARTIFGSTVPKQTFCMVATPT